MPGITGIISLSDKRPDIPLMVQCMLHEPEYKSGTYFNESLGIYTGWVCHRGSYADCMPVYSESKNIVMLFAGENYMDSSVINILKDKNHVFEPGNASSIVHLYQEKGEDFLSFLNGWFSGILIDLNTRDIFLFNDRYGLGRIYYYENDNEFMFSTQAKSLLKIRPELRQIDLKSLGEYFTCGCVLENRSLFSNINIMPGGSVWIFKQNKECSKKRYFTPNSLEMESSLGKDEFYFKLNNTFKDIMPKYYESKKDIAISMTGGLDTRIILAFMKNLHPGQLSCYTFGGIYRDSYDVKISRELSNKLQQKFEVLKVGQEYLKDFSVFAENTIKISDGCLDISGSTELYVNRLARRISPIRLTGNYGGEVLRGVRSFKAHPLCEEIYHPDFIPYIRDTVKEFPNIMRGHHLTSAIFKQAPWFGYGRFAIEQSQLTVRTPYLDNALVDLMYLAPLDVNKTDGISLRLISDNNNMLHEIKTDRGKGGSKKDLSYYFNRIYLEMLFKSEYYYNYGMPQWLSMIDSKFFPLHLEKLFLGWHKFHHFRIWYRDELSRYVQEIILDRKTNERPFLNKMFLEKMVKSHIRGTGNYTSEINNIISVELIHRLLIEQL